MWPEMNRYIKHVLSQEMGDIDFDIVTFDNHWEIHVDGKRVADIGVAKLDEDELPPMVQEPNKTSLN